MLSGDSNQAALLKDKKIRIITVSEIRYEGTLYQINTKDKTIALKNVVAFGTEDRRADQVIPPSQNVYELIIFKASHIKDINVLTQEEESKTQVANKEEIQQIKPASHGDKHSGHKDSSPKDDNKHRRDREDSREYREKEDRNDNYDEEEYGEYERKDQPPRDRHQQGYQKNNYNRDHHDRDRNYNQGGHSGYKRREGGGGYQQSGNSGQPRQPRENKGPKNFDFEEMVEKNNLLEKEKEAKEKDVKEEDSKYVFDNFFDKISTSVNDKPEGGAKKDPYHLYKTNNETFGFQKRPHQRGGNYRGGSRGGYRGGNTRGRDRDDNYGDNRRYNDNRDNNRDSRDNRDGRDNRDNRGYRDDRDYKQRDRDYDRDVPREARGGRGGSYRPPRSGRGGTYEDSENGYDKKY